ncbi:MAG: translocation/assembly module TamB, partial [Prosthecobacter sp.]|nr:translocation/assembly module TamB [Prosthecobacter sp.]
MDIDHPAQASDEHGHTRLWLWVKRGFLLLLTLVVLAVAFHRPLLRWTLERGGSWVAKRAGYDLQWKVHGDILSTLHLQDVHVRGPVEGVLKAVDVREATARYDLWDLTRKGMGHFLRDVSVSDASIELDLRAQTPAVDTSASKPLPEIWVDRVNLENINLHAVTRDGDMVLRGFSLLLDDKQRGALAIAELQVPSAGVHAARIQAKTAVAGRTLTITDLYIMPEVQVPLLEVDLAALHDSKLPFKLELRSSQATLGASGVFQDWGTQPLLDGMVVLNRLSQAEVGRWVHLPEDLAWRVKEARLRVRGDPAQPRTLTAELMLDAMGLAASGVQADRLTARASMHAGALQVESLALRAGANTVELSASAALPATWGEMARLSAEANWRVDGPKLAEVLGKKADVSGSLQGSGTVGLTAGRLTKADGFLRGSQLKYAQWGLESLQADLSSDATGVQIRAVTARLDEHNSATVSGRLQWDERQSAEL